MRYLFNMDDIINQELLKENQDLAKVLSKRNEQIEQLTKALDEVALPALREYEQYSNNPLRLIAKKAMKEILELLK